MSNFIDIKPKLCIFHKEFQQIFFEFFWNILKGVIHKRIVKKINEKNKEFNNN